MEPTQIKQHRHPRKNQKGATRFTLNDHRRKTSTSALINKLHGLANT